MQSNRAPFGDTPDRGGPARLREQLVAAAVHLVRSLWAELGACDGERDHQAFAIDPEQLIAFSGVLADADEQLDDRVAQWCAENRRYLSEARLRNVAPDFGWRRHVPLERSAGPGRRVEVDFTRPALLSLRLRALFGTGARAEVVGYLIASRGRGVRAHHLAREAGYSKRAVIDALEGLVKAGIVAAERDRGNVVYSFHRFEHAAELFGRLPDIFVRWRSLFRMLGRLLDELGVLKGEERFLAIEAMRLAQRIDGDVWRAGIRPLDRLFVSGRLWDVFDTWATDTAWKLARGDPSLFAAG